jgi:general stress protein CsbA
MKRRPLFRILGFVLCIVPPLLAALDRFPLLTTAGKVSMGFTFAAFLCCIPLYKHFKRILASPSAWVMWLVIFALCALLKGFIDDFYIISLIGFVSSVLGAVCFKISGFQKSNDGGEA